MPRDERRQARRYELVTSLLLRVGGTTEWRCGRLIDVSVMGLSCRSAGPPLPPATRVEFLLPLAIVTARPGPIVYGVGRVVRVMESSAGWPDTSAAVGIAIEQAAMLPVPTGRTRTTSRTGGAGTSKALAP